MHIGLLHVTCFLPETHTIKERRSVSKYIQNMLRTKFNVSVAEEPSDQPSELSFHIAFINSDAAHVDKVLDAVFKHIKFHRKQLQILDFQRQML